MLLLFIKGLISHFLPLFCRIYGWISESVYYFSVFLIACGVWFALIEEVKALIMLLFTMWDLAVIEVIGRFWFEIGLIGEVSCYGSCLETLNFIVFTSLMDEFLELRLEGNMAQFILANLWEEAGLVEFLSYVLENPPLEVLIFYIFLIFILFQRLFYKYYHQVL